MGQGIAGWDARAMSDDDLCAAALALSGLQSLIAAGKAHVLAELDARGVTDREDGLATGSWLAREAGIPKGAARREVKVAGKLRALPEVERRCLLGGSGRPMPACWSMRAIRGLPMRSWGCRACSSD